MIYAHGEESGISIHTFAENRSAGSILHPIQIFFGLGDDSFAPISTIRAEIRAVSKHIQAKEVSNNSPISHHHSSIIQRLLQRIIPLFLILRPFPQHGELLADVLVEEGEKRDGREDYVGDE